jgi:hypothetical protein
MRVCEVGRQRGGDHFFSIRETGPEIVLISNPLSRGGPHETALAVIGTGWAKPQGCSAIRESNYHQRTMVLNRIQGCNVTYHISTDTEDRGVLVARATNCNTQQAYQFDRVNNANSPLIIPETSLHECTALAA